MCVRNVHIYITHLLILITLIGAEYCDARQSISGPISSASFIDIFSWHGLSVNRKMSLLLLVSDKGTPDNPRHEAVFTVFARNSRQKQVPMVSTDHIPLNIAYIVNGISVYKDVSRGVLVCNICISGGDAIGAIIIAVNNAGKAKVLYSGMNWGNPHFEIKNGSARIIETWPLYRFEQKFGRQSANKYKGHVLVERIFTPRADGIFIYRTTRPAMAAEKSLSKRERGMLQKYLNN